jgi:hypothetical protein
MLRDLSKIIDDEDSEGGDGERLQRELRQAAQSLWRAQFIYENDWGMKTSYEVLRRYTGYFENLFDALGYRVVGRPNDGYVGLVANELPPRQSMKLDESRRSHRGHRISRSQGLSTFSRRKNGHDKDKISHTSD